MHERAESKRYQEEFEVWMDKLRVMENYLSTEEKSPNLLKKIREIRSALAYFRVDNPENKPSSTNEAIFKQKIIAVQQSVNTSTPAEKSELSSVIAALQSKKNTEDKNYQWIKECFEELRGTKSLKKTFISFLQDFATYISKIWKNKEASNTPIFFKPPAPVWSREEEKKALENKDSKEHKRTIQQLEGKSVLQPRRR